MTARLGRDWARERKVDGSEIAVALSKAIPGTVPPYPDSFRLSSRVARWNFDLPLEIEDHAGKKCYERMRGNRADDDRRIADFTCLHAHHQREIIRLSRDRY